MAENRSFNTEDGILARVRYPPSGFNPVEARIAAAILEDPSLVSRESIVSLARRTSVSTGSVVRFARALGMSGFRDLKLALAAVAIESRSREGHEGRSRLQAILDEQIRAIALARECIDNVAMEEAAFVISRARRIDLVATGSTAAVAHSLLFSLTLLGLHARFLQDAAEQGAAAGFLTEQDCLVAISVSGKTRPIVDAAARAAGNGCPVIALCGSNRAPLLRHTGIALVIDAQKGKFEEPPIRTALIAVSRALTRYVADQLPEEELQRRRGTWSSGRFGLRLSS
jgi:DNA-binding MurR/RpiR family transcriptional regulator